MGPNGAVMLAGIVVSAVMGGFAGLAFAVSHEQGLMQSLLAYQLGGLLAIMAFVALARPVSQRRN